MATALEAIACDDVAPIPAKTEKPPKPLVTDVWAKLAELGHDMKNCGTDRKERYQCSRCLITCKAHEASMLIQGGPCLPLETRTGQAAATASTRNDWKLLIPPVTVGKHTLHDSHKCYIKKGLIVCFDCGGIASQVPRKLLSVCDGTLNRRGREIMDRVSKGLTPDPRVPWRE